MNNLDATKTDYDHFVSPHIAMQDLQESISISADAYAMSLLNVAPSTYAKLPQTANAIVSQVRVISNSVD